MTNQDTKDGAPAKIIYLGACLIAAVRLAREERWGKSKTYQVVGRAEEQGYIVDGGDRGFYRLLSNRIETPLNLPRKIKLTAEDFRISTRTEGENFHDSVFPPR